VRVDYGNSDLNEVIEQLRPKLPEYLQTHGILPDDWSPDNNQKFKCINPDHDDNNPSMMLVARLDYTVARCYSCQNRVDIFKAATWTEGLPEDGKDWILTTVYGLAREYDIDFVEYEPTAEELAKAKILQMLSDAADCLVGCAITSKNIDGFALTAERGLTKELCKEVGVATVHWPEFVDAMSRYGGWEQDFMEAHGISDRTFGKEFITITLRDERGIVIGFDRRYANWDKETEATFRKLGKPNEYPKKWLLPRASDIFNPRTFLYGLDRAKNKAFKRLDIVEGYFDALSGVQAGHETIVACCGTAGIKDEQMELLVSLDFEDICIVFDSDAAGDRAVKRYLKEFGGRREFRLKFKFIVWDADTTVPEKDRDPDTFFRMFCKDSIEPYENVEVLSSFRVSLGMEVDKGTKGEDLARAQVPHIVGETDPLLRGRMIKELAEQTEVSEMDIRAAVDHILSGKARNALRDLERDLKKFDRNVSPQDLSNILKRTETKLSPLFGGSALAVTSRAAKAVFYEAMDFFDNDRGAIAGYRTLIPCLDEYMGGIQKGMFWAIAGNPNSGKSAFVHQALSGMCRSYKENKDMMILFFSFDDTTQWAWAKQFSCYSGLPIKWVARPQKYIYHDRELTKMYREAQAFLKDRVEDSMRIFGGDIGMNIDQIKKAIRDVQDSTGKHPVVVVDSFNKMQSSDGAEGREKFERNADGLHQLMHDGMTVIVTAETVKAAQGRKPTMGDMSDTKKLAYNANAVSIVYNPLHEEREEAKFFHVRHDDEKDRWCKAAVVQMDMVKNKITDYKDSSVFQFNDHIGTFDEIRHIQSFMDRQIRTWQQFGNNNLLTKEDPAGAPNNDPYRPAVAVSGGKEFNL